MRLTPTLAAATLGVAALGSAFLVTGSATAGQYDAATGGGQILFSSDGGAGNTIAFTAQGTADGARGQVQYVNREGGKGRSQVVKHGTVTCIDAEGTVARIAGEWRDGGTFGLYVQDNGEGAAADNDVVTIVPGVSDCDFDDPDSPTMLARGNAQVRDRG